MQSLHLPDFLHNTYHNDLIDEAAAAIKIETESMPTELDELKRKITQIEIELAALKREKSEIAKNRKTQQEVELEKLKKQANGVEERWTKQKDMIQKIQEVRSKIDAYRIELEQSERDVDLQKAAEIKYGKIPELEKKLNELHSEWDTIPN